MEDSYSKLICEVWDVQDKVYPNVWKEIWCHNYPCYNYILPIFVWVADVRK
jgi:hypothetical protein